MPENDAGPIAVIRENYDRLAEEYSSHVYAELANKPLDRELLGRFAASVTGCGQVCDMGCGPAHIARFLHDSGVAVFGLDLSPQMLAQARRLNPGIEFREGNLLALDLPNSSLAGITVFYAIVNLPLDSLPTVFGEMARVLQPDGRLLLTIHVGDEDIRPGELWGQPITMPFRLHDPEFIRKLLTEAGFEIEEIVRREPYAPEVEYQTRRAFLFARKPAAQTL